MQSRVLIPATVILCALLLRAAIGQQAAPPNQPPPSPFSGREDPYFPKATPTQRFPIVNQPAPLPKFGSLAEEPAAEPPVPGIRTPILR
ncbi:MAG: hypothetical protein K8R36_17180, partial [Planctomycetales bacterium]|nr:hypothetical protein [Planctomycetales bacterium]